MGLVIRVEETSPSGRKWSDAHTTWVGRASGIGDAGRYSPPLDLPVTPGGRRYSGSGLRGPQPSRTRHRLLPLWSSDWVPERCL